MINADFILENWHIIVFLIFAIAILGVFIYKFIRTPKEQQIQMIKEWLKYAVVLAESELGSGTGQLKLRMVYNLFVTKFPALAKLISFEIFSTYVDEALEWLNTQIENNKSVEILLSGKPKNTEEVAK